MIDCIEELTVKPLIFTVDPAQTFHGRDKVIDSDVAIIILVRLLEDAAYVRLARELRDVLKIYHRHAPCFASLPLKSENQSLCEAPKTQIASLTRACDCKIASLMRLLIWHLETGSLPLQWHCSR